MFSHSQSLLNFAYCLVMKNVTDGPTNKQGDSMGNMHFFLGITY